jgi:hypothetical protein
MSIAVLFAPKSMSARQYDEVLRRLDAAGALPAPGGVAHTCYGSGDQLRVFDVWESRAAFEQFGKTLLPILAQVGIEIGPPEIIEIHNHFSVEVPPQAPATRNAA